jgi:hypothetical protein
MLSLGNADAYPHVDCPAQTKAAAQFRRFVRKDVSEWKKNFGTNNAPAPIATIQPTLKEFNDLTMKLEFVAVA